MSQLPLIALPVNITIGLIKLPIIALFQKIYKNLHPPIIIYGRISPNLSTHFHVVTVQFELSNVFAVLGCGCILYYTSSNVMQRKIGVMKILPTNLSSLRVVETFNYIDIENNEYWPYLISLFFQSSIGFHLPKLSH